MRPLLGLAIVLLACPWLRADPAGESPRVARVEAVGPMIWPRHGHAATLLPDGRVLITGGSAHGQESPMPWAEVFDPATGAFRPTGALAVPRLYHVAVVLADGRVLVAGGWRAGFVLPTDVAEVWDPTLDRFVPAGRMTVARGSGISAVALADGRVLLIGGTAEGEFGMASGVIDVFDPSTLTFARWGSLVRARTNAGVLRLDEGRLLVYGGNFRCCNHPSNDSRNGSQEILDLRTRSSVLGPDMPFKLSSAVESELGSCSAMSAAVVFAWPGRLFTFDQRWKAGPEAERSLHDGCERGHRLSENVFVAAWAGQLLAVDLAAGRSETLDTGGPTSHSPTMTSLRCGAALVAGGYLDDQRPSSAAWVVSIRE